MKICSKCGVGKELSEFHRDSRNKDGYRNDCKECRNSGKCRKPPKLLSIKVCLKCNKEFTPTSNRQIWCNVCSPIERRKNRIKSCKEYYHENKELKGCHPTGENSASYKDGIGLYKFKRKDKCERCESVKHLVVHHIDRNRHNNKDSNLETLCRKCHFREHHIKDSQGRFFKTK